MKRTIALALTLVLMLSSMLILSACGKSAKLIFTDYKTQEIAKEYYSDDKNDVAMINEIMDYIENAQDVDDTVISDKTPTYTMILKDPKDEKYDITFSIYFIDDRVVYHMHTFETDNKSTTNSEYSAQIADITATQFEDKYISQ